MTDKITYISTLETLQKIDELIINNQGDIGRLRYIAALLKKGRNLYKSDQNYLEKKIGARTILEEPKKPSKKDQLLRSVQNLIARGVGDPDRMRYILHSLKKGRDLFKTDIRYVQEKIAAPIPFKPKIKPPSPIQKPALKDKIPPIPSEETYTDQYVLRLKTELDLAKETIKNLEVIIKRQKFEIQRLREELTQEFPVSPVDSSELNDISKRIESETSKIANQKQLAEKLKSQREKLADLISYREEYEKRVSDEKKLLEEKLRLENQKIAEKDKTVEQMAKKQVDLKRMQAESEVIKEQIKVEQSKIEPELEKLRLELEQLKVDYEKIVKEAVAKKDRLRKTMDEEKEKIDKSKKDDD